MTSQPTQLTDLKGALVPEESFSAFRNAFYGNLTVAGDLDYDQKRKVWNKMIDKKPGIIATCKGVSDVISAVKFAKANNLLVSVRGGGHSVAGYSVCDGGIVIDLSWMNTVMVDPEKKKVTVQGGATWLDVDQETQAFGLACPGGVVSDTGVGGLTLNGGVSWFRRYAGMSIDNLLGAEMVLADGSFVKVNENVNSDLFWAIRGGGGNFGIVTSFEFKLYELGPEVMFAACMYPRENAKEVLEGWLKFTDNAPKEITSDCVLWHVPTHPNFPEHLHKKPVMVVSALYAGIPEDGESALKRLRELATPLLDMSNFYPYQAVQQMFDAFLPKGKFQSYWKSLYFEQLNSEIQDIVFKSIHKVPSTDTLISIRHMGGAIQEIPADQTALGSRDGQYLLSIDSMWEDPQKDQVNIDWTRELFNQLSAHAHEHVYFNFMYDGEESVVHEGYGNNYNRLVEIKTKYDPGNLFSLNANIKPQKMADESALF